ncbi:MAG TPA: VC0807 family protein [Candidatus Dormibacteraeota bacterium]
MRVALDSPNVHERIARSLKEHPPKKGMWFNVAVTLVEIGGAIGLFHLAQGLGASDAASYLAGSAAPIVGATAVWVRARKFSGASAAIFAFTAVSAIIAVAGSSTPKVLLYKDCAATALIGLIFLGSCVVSRKPLVFHLAQRYGTDGTHEGMANFDTMWEIYTDFRTGMYVINYLWAALFVVQAAATALIIRQATYSTAYNYDQILPLVAVALGILGSIALGRHFAQKGRARGAAANAVGTDPA